MSTNKSYENFGVCVIVLNAKGQILLGERINSYRAGWFGMPGGRIELKETIYEAGERELMEETGTESKSLEYVGVIREFQETFNFIHFGFIANGVYGEPKNMEPDKCKGWQWYDLDSLPDKILPGHKAALDIYLKSDTSLRDLV